MKNITHFCDTGAGKKMDGGFFQRISDSSALVPVGYGATGFLGSTPLWVKDLTGLLELGAVIFAVLVGATTLYINVLNIIEKHNKRERVRKRGANRKIS